MENLLSATLEALEQYGKSSSDVLWCGDDAKWYSWDEFASIANFEYDDSCGGAEISKNLKIVGEDWWLERGEYDGTEWWEFKTLPKRPDTHFVPESPKSYR